MFPLEGEEPLFHEPVASQLGIRYAERDPTVSFLVQVAGRVTGQHFPMRIQIRQIGGRVGNSPDQAGDAFPLKPQLYFFRGTVEYPAGAGMFCFQFFQPHVRIVFFCPCGFNQLKRHTFDSQRFFQLVKFHPNALGDVPDRNGGEEANAFFQQGQRLHRACRSPDDFPGPVFIRSRYEALFLQLREGFPDGSPAGGERFA